MFVLALAFLCSMPSFSTESFRDREVMWNPFGDNLTVKKESSPDRTRPEGVRYYLHDDYNLSLSIVNYFVMPDELPKFMKRLNPFLNNSANKDNRDWPLTNRDLSCGIGRLTDEELIRFLREYSSSIRHNGKTVNVSYQGISNRAGAMGSILGGDCPDGITYVSHLMRALAPGAYEITSLFPKEVKVKTGLMPGKEIKFDIRDYTYRFSLADIQGRVSRFSTYPVTVNLSEKHEHGGKIYNIFFPVSYQDSPAKTPVGKTSGEKPALSPSLTCSQVLDSSVCNTWVRGKPALLSAGLKWSGKTVSEIKTNVTFTENGRKIASFPFTFKREPSPKEKFQGSDCACLVFTPMSCGLKEYEAIIEPVNSIPGKFSFKIFRVRESINIIEVKRKLRIHFTSVAVGTWKDRERIDEELFKRFKNDQLTFMRGMYPLPPENIIDVSSSTLMLAPQKATGESVTGITRMSLLARLEALYQPGQVDYAIGIVPGDWMKDCGVTEPRFSPCCAYICAKQFIYRFCSGA